MNTASLSATQPVFAGGRIYYGNKLAKLGYDVSLQKKQLTADEVLVKTENIYWNTVALQEKLKTVESYEKMLQQLLNDVTVAVKAGLTQRSDMELGHFCRNFRKRKPLWLAFPPSAYGDACRGFRIFHIPKIIR